MPDTVESLCQKARQAVAQGDHDQARKLYLQGLALKADVPDVHYGLATVCFLENDLPNAAHHFREVTRLDPLRAGAFINLGAVYNLLERIDEAITALQRGIQLDTHRGEGYYNLGLAYKKKGQPHLALQAYREAVHVNPKMGDAHLNLANLYVDMQEYGLALAHYKHALETRPGWEKALHGLAAAETALRDAERPRAAAQVEPPPVPQPAAKRDLNQMVDPAIHGSLLGTLHKATIDSETHGRQFLQIIEHEIEPAIKELSSVLLYPNKSARDLDQCVRKFETALENMRGAQRTLQSSMQRVRAIGDKLLRS